MSGIILASQSPRRKMLLDLMGLEFEVVPSNFYEQLDDTRSPEALAIELALGKASDVAADYPDDIVIGSDTIVTIDGKQLGKPSDNEEALAMLKQLAGKTHQVTTAVAVIRKSDNTRLTGADTTDVEFKPFDVDIFTRYVQTGDTLDKAGGYGIHTGGAAFIDHIEGTYDTVIGLPTRLVADLLAKLGIKTSAVELTCPVRQIFN